MKLFQLFAASTVLATASAWQVDITWRGGTRPLTFKGTKDTHCNTIAWPSGKKQEDVNWFNYQPHTPNWPDPKWFTVYPGRTCGDGGVRYGPGIHRPPKEHWVGSYKITGGLPADFREGTDEAQVELK